MGKLIVMQCEGVTPSLNTNCKTPLSSLEEGDDDEINPDFEIYRKDALEASLDHLAGKFFTKKNTFQLTHFND